VIHFFKIRWKCFEYIKIGTHLETGKDKKRIDEVFKETSAREFIAYLKPKVSGFVKHNFIANWQDQQCKDMMANVPEGMLISHIDFAENYSFQIQNEVQPLLENSVPKSTKNQHESVDFLVDLDVLIWVLFN